MDEMTKVTIATISGFIIAFFAEPVKNFFQNLGSVNRLRLALYRELVFNYINVNTAITAIKKGTFEPAMVKHLIRTECYRNSLSSSISVFYQLRDTFVIHTLYSILNYVGQTLEAIDDTDYSDFLGAARNYVDTFELNALQQSLDRQPLIRILGYIRYQKLIHGELQND